MRTFDAYVVCTKPRAPKIPNSHFPTEKKSADKIIIKHISVAQDDNPKA